MRKFNLIYLAQKAYHKFNNTYFYSQHEALSLLYTQKTALELVSEPAILAAPNVKRLMVIILLTKTKWETREQEVAALNAVKRYYFKMSQLDPFELVTEPATYVDEVRNMTNEVLTSALDYLKNYISTNTKRLYL